MKRNLLAIAIPALLVAGAANASIEVWNKDGNKLDVYGRVYALNYMTDSKNKVDNNGDNTTARIGFVGQTQITDGLTGYGKFEWETKTGSDADNETRYAFAGLNFGQYGAVDYGRNDGALKAITAYTDVLPEFGGDSTGYTLLGHRTGAVATYRNTDFFGMVDGLSFAVQYADQVETSNYETYADRKGSVSDAVKDHEAYGLNVQYAILDTGLTVGLGYAQSTGDADARSWIAGINYDANNLYLAAMYVDTKIDKAAGYDNNNVPNNSDDKIKGFEVVAQYAIDFEVGTLTPSIAYIQHQNKQNLVSGKGKYLAKYVEVGATYDFNKNFSAIVDYKINLLDKEDRTAKNNSKNTKDTLALGVIYRF